MCISYKSLSYSVLHFIAISFFKYSLLEAFCRLFFSRRGKAGSCNDSKDGKKMKTKIRRSHLGGKYGTILLVKMGRNKEEDRKHIVETHLGSDVKSDINIVVLSLGESKRMSILQLSPPACSPHSSSRSEEAKAWQQVRQPCGSPQTLLLTSSWCPCCFWRELKQLPHLAIILHPPGSHSRGAQQLSQWCNFWGGPCCCRLYGSFALTQQHRAHRVCCQRQVRKLLAPDS